MKVNKILYTVFLFVTFLGIIGVSLNLLGFGSFVTLHLNDTTGGWYYTFDIRNYLDNITTNLTNVGGYFSGNDLDLNAHINFDGADNLTAMVNGFKSVIDILIWVINLIVMIIFKLTASFLDILISILGVNLKGSALEWLGDMLTTMGTLSVPYLIN